MKPAGHGEGGDNPVLPLVIFPEDLLRVRGGLQLTVKNGAQIFILGYLLGFAPVCFAVVTNRNFKKCVPHFFQ